MIDNVKEKIEDKIIDLIALGASGRLVVFKPEKSDKDLIVDRRSSYDKKTISLNIYEGNFFNDQDIQIKVKELAEQKNLNADEDFYLIFVYFDVVKQDISDNFWVIPSSKLTGLINEEDFSKFLISRGDFIRFLIEEK